MYVIGVPELKTRAISMLLLYCFMFVLPLIIIFLLAGYGIKLKKLINISKKNTVYSKLLISLIFLFLSIYMFYIVFY
jgi:cadmium resistance protein CadD (predicted permease)